MADSEKIDDLFLQFLCFINWSKLDPRTLRDREISLTSMSTAPNYDNIEKFLQGRAFTQENSFFMKAKQESSTRFFEKSKSLFEKKSFVIQKAKCLVCSLEHYINRCSEFLATSPSQWFAVIKS